MPCTSHCLALAGFWWEVASGGHWQDTPHQQGRVWLPLGPGHRHLQGCKACVPS